MLTVNQLSLIISQKQILTKINLRVQKGEILVIVGRNGSGKSSLLRCLSGWYQPTQGTIELNQKNLQSYSTKDKAELISFLPQRSRLSESIPIIDLVAAARYRFNESLALRRQKAREFLDQYQILHLQNRDWSTLSGGEAQRVALTCMRAQEASLWLLDEPGNHLDPAVQREMYRYLFCQWKMGTSLIVVTHNLNLILNTFSPTDYPRVHVLGINQGEYAFCCRLSDEDLVDQISHLYHIPVKRVHAFEHDYLLFGDPLKFVEKGKEK